MAILDRGEVRARGVDFGFRKDSDAGGGQTRCGDAFAGNATTREAAVVHRMAAARRTGVLEDGDADPVSRARDERRLRTTIELVGDVATRRGQHTPAARGGCDFGRWPRRRQTTFNLWTDEHQPPFGCPGAKVWMLDARVASVIADALAEQACADQDLFHFQTVP